MGQSSRSQSVAAVCVALVLGCAAGANLDRIVVPARAEAGPRYQYKVLDVGVLLGSAGSNADKQQGLLNQFGAEGWHVVGAAEHKIYLERVLPDA